MSGWQTSVGLPICLTAYLSACLSVWQRLSTCLTALHTYACLSDSLLYVFIYVRQPAVQYVWSLADGLPIRLTPCRTPANLSIILLPICLTASCTPVNLSDSLPHTYLSMSCDRNTPSYLSDRLFRQPGSLPDATTTSATNNSNR
jgi:hypothetical protein